MKKAFPFIAAVVVLGVVTLVVWLAITEKIDFGNDETTTAVTETTSTAETTTATPVFEPLTDKNGEPVTDENGQTTLVEVTTVAQPASTAPTTTKRSFSFSKDLTTTVPHTSAHVDSGNQGTMITKDPWAMQNGYKYKFASDDDLEAQYRANKAPFDSFYGRSITVTEYLKWANSLVSSVKAQKKTGSDGCVYFYHNPVNEIVEFAVMTPDGYIRTYMLFTSIAEAQQVWSTIK